MTLVLRKFQAYDPYQSFSGAATKLGKCEFRNAEGENAFQHWYGLNSNGNPEEALWETGNKAYQVLVEKFGPDPTTDDIYQCLKPFEVQVKEWIDTFLDELIAKGRLLIDLNSDDGDWKGFAQGEFDVVYYVSVLYDIENKFKFKESILDYETAFAICCLKRVDNAIIARCLNFGGFGDCVIEVHDLLKKAMAQKDAKAVRSQLAGKGAQARHIETHALREEIIQYWKAHIDSKLSAEKAANSLVKIFPLSHRKISQYVASEKKLLRASKA